MSPAALRALADRVESEEPSDELLALVLRSFGWEPDDSLFGAGTTGWRWRGGICVDNPPNPLTSIDAAAALMPEGWIVNVWLTPEKCTADTYISGGMYIGRYESVAPTEPRARTALACRVKAAVMEANDE